MISKREQRDAIINFCHNYSVKASVINPYLEQLGLQPVKQGVKLINLVLQPSLNLELLSDGLPEFREFIDSHIETERRDEIIEAAEVLMKYEGYIKREQLIADKLRRLEGVKIRGKLDYSTIKALSTEARQKLKKIDPETVGQASRIPGISPADVNILLLLMGR